MTKILESTYEYFEYDRFVANKKPAPNIKLAQVFLWIFVNSWGEPEKRRIAIGGINPPFIFAMMIIKIC